MLENISRYIRREQRLFFLAGSFLSRFFPSVECQEEEIVASVRYYPLLGLVLGLAGLFLVAVLQQSTLPVSDMTVIGGRNAIAPTLILLLTAFVYILWLAYATRGLHWDGWADLSDAYGAASVGDQEKFMRALKDSRIGAFGALALTFGVLGQVICTTGALERGLFWALAWAPLWGRQLALLLAYCSNRGFGAAPRSGGLGALCTRGATGRVLLATLLTSGLVGFLLVPVKALLLAMLFSLLPLYALLKLSRRGGVLNGDFLGAAIIGGELCVMLALIMGC